jgi:hypothetical protein
VTSANASHLELNRAAGLLTAIADADDDLLNPTIPLRCMTARALLIRAGAIPDPLPAPIHSLAITAAISEVLRLLAQLPAAVFNTDEILDAVTEVMLAHEATG